jgi:cytoskeletal protein CcmA (bactofilin family)
MFRKKNEDEDGGSASGSGQTNGKGSDLAAPPLKPFSRKGSHVPSKSSAGSAALRHDVPRRGVEPSRRYERMRPGESESKKLTVGRDICLAGEITSCNKLLVEGRVEASLNDAHAIEIAPTGFFKGAAEVIEADISGLYEGELIAREILTVRSGGRINGTVRYGRIVIEAGGEISGDMRALGHGEDDIDERSIKAEDKDGAEDGNAEDDADKAEK